MNFAKIVRLKFLDSLDLTGCNNEQNHAFKGFGSRIDFYYP